MKTPRPARPEEMEEVRKLFREYADSLGVDLCFQGFERELAELPGNYYTILVACVTGFSLSACVALRPLGDGIAEMKRMYVRPQYRGQGLGRKLAEAILQAARDRGYKSIRLDTLPHLHTAIAMYRRMGFQEIALFITTTQSQESFTWN